MHSILKTLINKAQHYVKQPSDLVSDARALPMKSKGIVLACGLALVIVPSLFATNSVAQVQELIEQYSDANGRCRGFDGTLLKTERACLERVHLGYKLNQLDRCYGRSSDESAAASMWHVCAEDSYRLTDEEYQAEVAEYQRSVAEYEEEERLVNNLSAIADSGDATPLGVALNASACFIRTNSFTVDETSTELESDKAQLRMMQDKFQGHLIRALMKTKLSEDDLAEIKVWDDALSLQSPAAVFSDTFCEPAISGYHKLYGGPIKTRSEAEDVALCWMAGNYIDIIKTQYGIATALNVAAHVVKRFGLTGNDGTVTREFFDLIGTQAEGAFAKLTAEQTKLLINREKMTWGDLTTPDQRNGIVNLLERAVYVCPKAPEKWGW